ncbi:MAG: hypothetical protein OHK93_005390 [Ramalina farinacea]|uniref:Uncharacterized protein n=1 Tax=Ramalina farinacea TaxID=258253 RepID=A0AA43QXQ2_9LECA|nr:hypothetical protein [Ramalina farinacea]
MAHPSLHPLSAHHLPYRPTTILLEDPPYLSLSGDNAIDGGAGADSFLCKGHGENVRCNDCNGGREDGTVNNENCGGGGSAMVLGIRGSGEEICDSDDEDEDEDGEGVVGWDTPSPCSSSSSPSSSPMTLMRHDIAVAKTGWKLPQRSSPLQPVLTVLPPAPGAESFHGSIFASAGMGSEDSIMADSCVDMEGCDSGYESALGGGGSCQLLDSDTNPRNRCCESPRSDLGGGGDFEALYQQLKRQVEGIGGGWQGWMSPGELNSPCESDEEMLGSMTGHSSMVVTAQREARGHMQRSGGKGLMGGGQKMRKVRKGGSGSKKVWRKRCGGGHAGVPWVS